MMITTIEKPFFEFTAFCNSFFQNGTGGNGVIRSPLFYFWKIFRRVNFI